MSNQSLLDKIKSSSKNSKAQLMSESEFFKDVKEYPTPVPAINIALSGKVDGGMSRGHLAIAGVSKHFKTSYSLLIASNYLKANPDAYMVFYDTEFGSPIDYFKSFGIDPNRVVHIPVVNVEQLKFDMVNLLENLEKGKEKIFILIDSIGNIASKKELEDAKDEKSVADMSRAKALKGLFRMITPFLSMKDVPLVSVNHTYSEMGLFPKEVMSGGRGAYYGANAVWMIGRRQQKEGKEISGYQFVIKIEKSRFVKEGQKIDVDVSYDKGIAKESGLLELGEEAGFIQKVGSRYQLFDFSTGDFDEKKVWKKDITWNGFYKKLVENEEFKKFVEKKYRISQDQMIEDDEEIEYEIEKVEDEE